VGEFWLTSVPALPAAASAGRTQRPGRPRRGRAGGPTAVLPGNSGGLEADETARLVQDP